MKNRLFSALIFILLYICVLTGCKTEVNLSTQNNKAEITYEYAEYPLERNGLNLHLDCMSVSGKETGKDILLIHGVTYSSNEFDTDYEDYSLVRKLAQDDYRVWRLDIAGFGQSETVEDGFMPDSDYAAEDIDAAVNKIVEVTGHDKIDVLGWSWGTVTTSRFASNNPDHIRKLVLYAPILTGIGEYEVTEAFHHNTWEHAADDFQRCGDGTFDYSIADKNVIEIFCSNCWHYDGEYSPNGGRRDICVSKDTDLIDLNKLKNPTLIICGGNDPYLNYDKIQSAKELLPEGSEVQVIDGGSHVIMIEKPYYHEFRDRLIRFLEKE
ncbi:MAG: alpha/beta hydrolase [Oribacterium sp.]|nr:alpha/beta hydrolase [Oribacterium sp.]